MFTPNLAVSREFGHVECQFTPRKCEAALLVIAECESTCTCETVDGAPYCRWALARVWHDGRHSGRKRDGITRGFPEISRGGGGGKKEGKKRKRAKKYSPNALREQCCYFLLVSGETDGKFMKILNAEKRIVRDTLANYRRDNLRADCRD